MGAAPLVASLASEWCGPLSVKRPRGLRLAAMRRHALPAILAIVQIRCLIVDDNAEFVAAARVILEGCRFTIAGTAATAVDALACVQDLQPDLVLLDIDLGEDSGFDVARQLNARETSSGPQVIFVSTHPGDEFADLIAESPALGFIAKAELSPAAILKLLAKP